jgi:site-specific recombinase XerD
LTGKWKIEKRDGASRTLDFHPLWRTYGTMLVNNGADIKVVQSLMRHLDSAAHVLDCPQPPPGHM